MSRILEETRALVEHAARDVYAATPHRARLDELGARLSEPLRVAIAGRVKAGKSTLLNALVADRLAPTDAGECTRIVTWYADGHTYQVLAELAAREAAGAPTTRQLAFERTDEAIRIDLGGLRTDEIERLRVSWPTRGLRTTTLIDTPGIGSMSEEVSARTWDLLAPEDEDTATDAVLYLMRHLHSNDVDFLRAFHDTAVSRPNPVNAIGVLSRADEVGAGRLDSMTSARKVAARMAGDPSVRQMVQTVVPVAGLLAETAATLVEAEYAALRQVAALGKGVSDPLLLSVDRFVSSTPAELVPDAATRAALLDRFGLFGVRLAVSMIRHGVVADSPGLSAELLRRSGILDLRDVLETMFHQRRDVLKSRAALLALDALTRAHPVAGSDRLAVEAERISASAHAFRELDVLSALRSGWVTGKPEVIAELERVVGGEGVRIHERLGLEPDSGPEARRTEAAAVLERWQRRAESPMTSHQLIAAARVVIQTCEGMLAELNGWSRS